MADPRKYERLTAWQLNHALALEVYRITETFPKREWYGGLASQLRRAAFAAAANIAEGSAKRGAIQFRPYLETSWASLNEVHYGLRFARDLDYVALSGWKKLTSQCEEAVMVTWGLYAAIARRAAAEKSKR